MAKMKCEDVRDAILQGRPLAGADFEEHLEACEACAGLDLASAAHVKQSDLGHTV